MDFSQFRRRCPRARPYLFDAVAAVSVTVVYLGFAAGGQTDGQPGFAGPPWLGWPVAAAVGLPLAVRRLWPSAVLATVVAGSVAALLLDLTLEPLLPVAFALYPVGLSSPRPRSAAALVAAVLVTGGGVVAGQAVVTPSEPVTGAVQFACVTALAQSVGWGAGVVVRRRRARAAADTVLATERARQDERLRIARELHDIVSHHLGMIAVKAGIANHLAATHPGEAAEALRVIEVTSRGALAEMRSMLDVLRTGTPPGRDRGPVPGLAGLSELANRAGEAGVAVSLDVRGAGRPPDGVGLTVYRIVQEALTNVVKHARASRCAVTVELGERWLAVEVADDGTGPEPGPGSGGHGLIGMRERVMMYQGDFTAGPGDGGGFTVSARIPFQPTEDAE